MDLKRGSWLLVRRYPGLSESQWIFQMIGAVLALALHEDKPLHKHAALKTFLYSLVFATHSFTECKTNQFPLFYLFTTFTVVERWTALTPFFKTEKGQHRRHHHPHPRVIMFFFQLFLMWGMDNHFPAGPQATKWLQFDFGL